MSNPRLTTTPTEDSPSGLMDEHPIKREPEEMAMATRSPVAAEPSSQPENRCKLAYQLKLRGDNALLLGQYLEAVEYFTEAIRLRSDKASYFCSRAGAYMALERNPDVIQDCNSALKLDPTCAWAYSRIGVSYARMEQPFVSLLCYQKALDLEPDNAILKRNVEVAETRVKGLNTTNLPSTSSQGSQVACPRSRKKKAGTSNITLMLSKEKLNKLFNPRCNINLKRGDRKCAAEGPHSLKKKV